MVHCERVLLRRFIVSFLNLKENWKENVFFPLVDWWHLFDEKDSHLKTFKYCWSYQVFHFRLDDSNSRYYSLKTRWKEENEMHDQVLMSVQWQEKQGKILNQSFYSFSLWQTCRYGIEWNCCSSSLCCRYVRIFYGSFQWNHRFNWKYDDYSCFSLC